MSSPEISRPTPTPRLSEKDAALLEAAYSRSSSAVKTAIEDGANVNARHPETGLTALHLAVGTNNLTLTRYLVEDCGARFGPDRFGRWPTSVAAHCRVAEPLCDYIVEAEAAALTERGRLLD